MKAVIYEAKPGDSIDNLLKTGTILWEGEVPEDTDINKLTEYVLIPYKLGIFALLGDDLFMLANDALRKSFEDIDKLDQN